MTTVNPSALAYVGAAYGWMPPTDPLLNPANTSSGQNNNNSAATNVTVSDAARALLATQNADDDFATVTANARAALDDLYKVAGVTSPLQDGKLTIDLSGLDRISVFAIASNSEGEFTADEQSAAAQELQNRFDAAMKPMKAAAEVVGDYSSLYKAALSYFDGMSAKEKAAPGWADQRAALAAGYQERSKIPARCRRALPMIRSRLSSSEARKPATPTAIRQRISPPSRPRRGRRSTRKPPRRRRRASCWYSTRNAKAASLVIFPASTINRCRRWRSTKAICSRRKKAAPRSRNLMRGRERASFRFFKAARGAIRVPSVSGLFSNIRP